MTDVFGFDPPPVIRDLRQADLELLAPSGDDDWLERMSEQLARVSTGELEYLVVVLPAASAGGAERLAGTGCVNYVEAPGCGVVNQLSVASDVQSRGLGTLLIRTMEARIRARGLGRAEIAVELENPRARRLYERLGYVAYDERPESWMQTSPAGLRYRYHTTCTWMRKALTDD